MSEHARFWPVDLHVHTPASRDVIERQYGSATPDDVVRAAIDAGLSAIAITDHNTAEWCDDVSAAAEGLPLVVLPGVEITTSEGHLLAIWEEGTQARIVHECLVTLGINGDDLGKLDISAGVGFADAAKRVTEAGGLAIAAHADQKKGLLEITVAAHLKRTLINESLSAVEIVDVSMASEIQRKVGSARSLAFVRGSDMTAPGQPGHRLNAIGNRRAWIKASRPDLCGLRHAFEDPSLRVRLDDPSADAAHPWIESLTIHGGFLGGADFDFSPDLNCLVGGTGTGKSLALECLRYALDQQVDEHAFSHIHHEVWSRLTDALGANNTVAVTVFGEDGERYVIERSFDSESDTSPVVRQALEDGDLVAIDVHPSEIIQISAFSQGEALEYSRERVGRMALVDAALDLTAVESEIVGHIDALRKNQTALLAQRAKVLELEGTLGPESGLRTRQAELEALFDSDTVKNQKAWKTDDSNITAILDELPEQHSLELELVVTDDEVQLDENQDLVDEARSIVAGANGSIEKSLGQIDKALADAATKSSALRSKWNKRYGAFKQELVEELDKVPGGKSLVALRQQLSQTQDALLKIGRTKKQLKEIAQPRLTELRQEREQILTDLMKARQVRRDLRRERIKELNLLTNQIVKLDLPHESDRAAFRQKLQEIKVGSRVGAGALDAIASTLHPAQFAEAMFDDKYAILADDAAGVSLEDLSRLYTSISDKDLWEEILQLQEIDTPDTLEIKFKRDSGGYAHIESLAHGQKCTAIIIVLLADGVSPVIVDQPEDALHAPWIEDHLVDRLRDLRGKRQYLFATRSPGIVISADAEQIVTMTATAGNGRVEAAGSLERHDLNKLVLHHLEGGPEALSRRHKKLLPSISG
jgi:AAA domain/PHP domain